MSDTTVENTLEELKPFINDKAVSETVSGHVNHFYDTLTEAIINNLQDIREKELAEKIILALDKNTFLNRKNIDMLGGFMMLNNIGALRDGLKLCAACARSVIVHTKPEKISNELAQMLCRIQKEMKEQHGSGQYELNRLLSGHTGEEEACQEEWSISGDDIDIEGGKYSYQLFIRTNGTVSFNNDLEINNQGIKGSYQLIFETEENGNNIITVTGNFENIIVASPLLEKCPDRSKNWIHSRIKGDTYSYQLLLRTQEGFTFKNILRFFFNSDLHGYSINYAYDLLTDKQSLNVNGITDADQIDKVY